MALTEEQKKQIEEEEKYREKVRGQLKEEKEEKKKEEKTEEPKKKKSKKGKGCLALILLGVGFLVLIGLIGAGGGGGEKEKSAPTPTSIKQEEATTPEEKAPGMSKEIPLSYGQPIKDDRGVEATVINVKRNAFIKYHEPKQGKEFILVTVKLENKSDRETVRYSPVNFRVTGEESVIYEETYASTDNRLESGEFYGGAEVEGELVFEVGEGEENLILIWDAGFGTSARYLSLEE